jgi:hypothetical protein
MRKKYFIAAGIIVLAGIALLAGMLFFRKGPDPSTYEFLKEPRITQLQDQKMLEVRVSGDPNLVGSKAFGPLFKTYFQLKRAVGGLEMVAPRARWPKPLSTPKSEWLGIYALPVPAFVTALPEQDSTGEVKVEIATWEYGDVAEILHVGPYSGEPPTVEKLQNFIKAQGYEIAGPHEEEYLKGPGMFFQGDPKTYYTIIRYRVKKTGR